MHCANTAIKGLRAVAAALLVAATAQVFAQTTNADLQRIRNDIARLKERLDAVRQRAQTLAQQVEAADLELSLRSRELQLALDEHSRLEEERAKIADEIGALIPRIETQKHYLRKRLVALYRMGGLSYVRMFLSIGQQGDPSAALSMLAFLVRHDAHMIGKFRAAQEELANRYIDLQERQKQIAEAAKVIQAKRQELAAAQKQRERLLARLRREESGSELQIAELEEKARRLERLVELLSKQSDGVIPAADVRAFRGALLWPLEGKVIEDFGRQRNAKFATYTMNNGLKIAAEPRTPIRAVFQGTVLFTQWFKGYGNLIILDHGNRVFSLYGNLIAPSVAVGDRIATGQAIAGAGESEDAQSGYLYFEIRQDNKPEDPRQWLR
jgi:murein hydrolase activator